MKLNMMGGHLLRKERLVHKNHVNNKIDLTCSSFFNPLFVQKSLSSDENKYASCAVDFFRKHLRSS
jgi:hypothetical protein